MQRDPTDLSSLSFSQEILRALWVRPVRAVRQIAARPIAQKSIMAMHHHMRQRMLEVDDLRPEVPRKQKPARERAPQEPDHYRHSRKKQDLRKTRQLCGQVAKILHLCLPQAVDPDLEGVYVLQVRSIDARRLEVVVTGPGPIDGILSALHRARPWLRDEVSQGIHRKRTPELVFAWSAE